jgi:hypothetical protein
LAAKTNGDLFACGYYGGGVWRSTNLGDSWLAANNGLDLGDILHDLFVEEDGGLLLATHTGGVFRTTDDGGIWTPINNGLTELKVYKILAAPGGTLFAGTHSGVFRSLDDGDNWELVDASLPTEAVRAIATNSQGDVFVGLRSDGLIYRSLDNGDSWQSITGNFPDVRIARLELDPTARLFVATGGLGVYYSLESTPTYLSLFTAARQTVGSVLLQWSTPGLDLDLSFDVYRAPMGGDRIRLTGRPITGGPSYSYLDAAAPQQECEYWLRGLSTYEGENWLGPVTATAAQRRTFTPSIESVWPNPCRRSTAISFAVPLGDLASLTVYDLRGRRVRQLIRDAGGSGPQETVWDLRDDSGRRVSAGTYLLRLESKGGVATEKTIVLGNKQ